MKTLSKLIAAAFVATMLLLTTNANAQTTPANALRFNIGLEVADPTGNARLGSHFILGGTARFQYGLTNNLAVTLTSGAFHFLAIDRPGTNMKYDSYGVIPIKAGLKEFFLPHIYVGLEAGAGLEITDSGWGQKKLDISPAVGYGSKHWDVGVHYDSLTGENNTYGVLGLRIAYGITSK
jgi:hypothetical protein